MDQKTALRKHLQFVRKTQFSSYIDQKSELIAQHLCQSTLFQNSSQIALYDALTHEVQTQQIFDHARALGKRCCYPKILEHQMHFVQVDTVDDLVMTSRGFREPRASKAVDHMDLIVVPAVGIDDWGHRLGQGGGHYDRFLASQKVRSVALIFDVQRRAHIPTQDHDQKVDYIASPHGVQRVL